MEYSRWKRAFDGLLGINEAEAHRRMADGCERWSGYFVSNLEPSSQRRAAEFSGAEAGHRFRAEELRYDARGGMTEAQARAVTEARAEAASELVDVMREVLATGTPCPLPDWSRDDMAEEQGETWDESRKGDG